MTGFAKAEISNEEFTAEIEIKTVNNRYLETQFKLPRMLSSLEPLFREELSKWITRGSVSCFVIYENKSESNNMLSINESLFKQYKMALGELKNQLGEASRIDLGGLLKIPDLLVYQSDPKLLENIKNQVLPVFSKACESLQKSREEEGQKLIGDLQNRLGLFGTWLSEVQNYLPGRIEDLREKYRSRISELCQQSSIAEERILIEAGMLGEKLDISEELVRFEAHLKLFQETLNRGGTPGKKLGFVLQEMLREVNTMSSKCQHSGIQHLCVDMKEEIEKMREQSMNLE